jgi:hypothetical protein
MAVRHGDGNWPGLDTARLCSEQLFAVCSPKLLSGRRRLGKPADILKFPLIHMDSRADWNNWLDRVSGQQNLGFAATGAQAGMDQGQAGMHYGYGQSEADRETSFSNAMAGSRNQGWNNLIGLGGVLMKGFAPGYGGDTAFGNMGRAGRNAMSGWW